MVRLQPVNVSKSQMVTGHMEFWNDFFSLKQKHDNCRNYREDTLMHVGLAATETQKRIPAMCTPEQSWMASSTH